MRRVAPHFCRWVVGASLVVSSGVALQAQDASGPPQAAPVPSVASEPPPYKNPALPVDRRVADLIGRMTLDEKAAAVEMDSPAIERLGVPAWSWWSEGLHGVARAGEATVFPQAIALAATWDPPLIHDVMAAVADEARVKHYQAPGRRNFGLTYWCPTVNMARDPRWGRTEETFGEDPFLCGRLAVAYVQGLQGDNPRYLKIAATPKHLAVHSQETDRQTRCFDVSPRALHEYYLPAFRACFVEGKAVSVMTAHSGFNNTPNAANPWLLTDLLRKQWGFDGAVVTDWGGVRRLKDAHHIVNSDEDAVVASVTAGVDVLCEPKTIKPQVVNAVNLGLLSEKVLDQALARGLKIRFRLGEFDPPEMVPYTQIPPGAIGAREHVALALQAARESIVLLKNAAVPRVTAGRPVLPLNRSWLESIAVLGPYADECQFGAYSGKPANPPVSVLEGVRRLAGPGVLVKHVKWGDTEGAARAALSCDVAVVVVGLNHQIEKEGADRPDIDLPRLQQEFVERIVKSNPATVVVLEGGGQVAVTWIHEHAAAVLDAWYPGEQGGTAVAEVLFGDCNPGGRLPLTFYAGLQQLPPLDDYEVSLGRTYMYLQTPPLYPFGHGLSYTTFAYDHLVIDPPDAGPTAAVAVRLRLTNTGGRAGDEVVQLYVRATASSVTRPLKQLKGFQRVHLAPGQSADLSLPLRVDDLTYWDEHAEKFIVEPGTYEVMVGASSNDIRLRGRLEVK